MLGDQEHWHYICLKKFSIFACSIEQSELSENVKQYVDHYLFTAPQNTIEQSELSEYVTTYLVFTISKLMEV